MDNSLAKVHPKLVCEWSDRNLPITADMVTFGSNKMAWWKGICGHEWETSIKARSNGEGCPICSGARAVEGINDLATLKPDLAKEWSDKNKKLKPTMVTIGSSKKVVLLWSSIFVTFVAKKIHWIVAWILPESPVYVKDASHRPGRLCP